MDDGGQTTPLMAAAVGLVTVLLLGLGPMGGAVVARAQARTAADAAALAGAAEGEVAARSAATANDGDLLSYETEGDEVVAEVEVRGVRAFGRARQIDVPDPGPGAVAPVGTGERAGLAPAMLAALDRADELLGEAVPVVSGYRSPERQRELWDRRHANPYPVAPPGSSLHERGLAVDVPGGAVDDLLSVADRAGLCQPLPATDPVHFVLCESR